MIQLGFQLCNFLGYPGDHDQHQLAAVCQFFGGQRAFSACGLSSCGVGGVGDACCGCGFGSASALIRVTASNSSVALLAFAFTAPAAAFA